MAIKITLSLTVATRLRLVLEDAIVRVPMSVEMFRDMTLLSTELRNKLEAALPAPSTKQRGS